MRINWSVRPIAHMYWVKKNKFDLDSDIYPYWTIFAVEEGRFAYRILDQEGEAGFGSLVVCPPETRFYRRTLEPVTFHFLQFAWEQEPDPDEWQQLCGKLNISDIERLASDFRYLRRQKLEQDEAAMARIQHMVNDLWRLVEMERSLQEEKDRVAKYDDGKILKAARFIDANAYGPIDMRNLALSLQLSPVQLTRRFHEAYGLPPSDYATKLRLDRASRLLLETDLNIDNIARICGYENGFYFSRLFRKKRGIPPSQYRNTHRV
ncbi:AraC family transcriptional regulator [Cohnella sp. WQ 127256]|uniref:AraC family transcriptional regulator n=1 Tax=Cohnella sp. WQ 127256 TaxID=2938790 RepID=UPI002118B1B1|nr:AraC family transcriptional regulator [Cohnella sp. WQ 127256]